MKTAIIIPASAKSQRLPRKALLAETGKPLVLHTYEAALQSKLADEVWIAADEECFGAIQEWCHIPGCFCYALKMRQVDGDYRNGTHRVAAAAKALGDRFDIIVNLQCDEPLVTGEMMDALIRRMQQRHDNPELSKYPSIGTLVSPIRDDAYLDESSVFAAIDHGVIVYFSREVLGGSMQHIGVYAFQRDVLIRVASYPQSEVGKAEGLEQLDWIVAEDVVHAVEVSRAPLSINTRADYDRFVEMMRQPV